jgi:hypothetical protein
MMNYDNIVGYFSPLRQRFCKMKSDICGITMTEVWLCKDYSGNPCNATLHSCSTQTTNYFEVLAMNMTQEFLGFFFSIQISFLLQNDTLSCFRA